MNINAVLADKAELAVRAATEPVAFASIYDHYVSRVYKYMRYRVGDPTEAEDLTSQVFERVLAKIGGYCPERGPFAGWLFAIAHNTVVDYLRSQKRHRLVPLEVMAEAACSGTGPEEVVINIETREKLLAALSRLTDRERNLVALKFSAGLTNRAIAGITGLTESNVAVILFRAMRRLRAELEAKGAGRG
ncbi:DNA-directed RNA polymerase specialized sigma subunit, sigma24 homolog [Pelotomaculum thermopropionicum SI]|uniref:DNA-directed RNA polymerase specialized sigma subunit, sigma24 homolog n=1 Tax=Pelotomaculum thermopropionicum (strain DSM 13744 / JCM 10971 / SI) TaxID=370438 RepID=A5CZY7_PELTS|nr:DNA-directed RNA polymerase specialized sigma subunit, sigma24 homolog [Pelotomaculum thermopropionicum SI]